jgi:hypothetical protein
MSKRRIKELERLLNRRVYDEVTPRQTRETEEARKELARLRKTSRTSKRR